MNEHNLFTTVKVTHLSSGSAADTAALTTTGVDMTGFDGVMIVTYFGSGNAGHTIEAKSGSASGSAAMTALPANILSGPGSTTGSASDAWSKAYAATSVVTTVLSEQAVMVDVYRPIKRYVGATITPAASSTIESVWAIQYRASNEPVINNDGSTKKGIVAQATQA